MAGRSSVDPRTYDPPERVVSLTPSNTEILFALGAGDRLVGVSEYCDYPTDALTLPRVSRFIDADEDTIVALRPDLVLTSSHLQKVIVEHLIDRDVTVLAFNPTDLDGIFRDILFLGRVVGALDRARALTAALQARVAAVVGAGKALAIHPKVYLEEWGKPLIPAGWWLADFIELAGGIPALPGVDTRRHSKDRIVGPEAVAAANPDVIVVSWPGVSNDVPKRMALNRPEWQDVAAIRHGRVHAVDDWLLHRPGPRVVDGLEAIARIVADTALAMERATENRSDPSKPLDRPD
ncbi:MAG TPA: cobalamin-binding protein [Chloroflexota bacterium]|nr:cobalamin-binding protein [Chloroflexota bacterium]